MTPVFVTAGRRWRVTVPAGGLPDAQLLAMLDADPQDCVFAESVREDGRIVDFRLVHINDAGCRLLARPRAELLGHRYRELWPETVNDGTLPLYRTVVETGRPVTRTVYFDRETIRGRFEMWIEPYGDGFAVRFVDLRQVTVVPGSTGGSRLYRAVAETGVPWLQQLPYPDIGQVWEIKIGRASDDFVAISFREVTEQVGQQDRLARSVTRAEQAAARATALQSVTQALVSASTTAQVFAGIGAVLRPSAGGQGLPCCSAMTAGCACSTTPATSPKSSNGCARSHRTIPTRPPRPHVPARPATWCRQPNSTRPNPTPRRAFRGVAGRPGPSCR